MPLVMISANITDERSHFSMNQFRLSPPEYLWAEHRNGGGRDEG
jgi:hypothetical protein